MIFDNNFMTAYKNQWNETKDVHEPLASINFESNIGYGFIGEKEPKAVLVVKKGLVEEAREYKGEPLNWDLRMTEKNWQYYFENGIGGLLGLGKCFTFVWIKFVHGDYFKMISTPQMIGPFLKTFDILGNLYKTTEKK